MPNNKIIKSKVQRSAMTDKQRVFVDEYCVDLDPVRAARAAGYKGSVGVTASRLMNPKLYPVVAAAIGNALRKREEKTELKAQDVLQYVHDAMTVNLLRWFEPGDNGGWLIAKNKLSTIPDRIGRLIESVEERTITLPDGTVIAKFWVRIVSKAEMTKLAAKHQLTQRLEVQHKMPLPWDDVYRDNSSNVIDLMEQEIKKLEAPDAE